MTVTRPAPLRLRSSLALRLALLFALATALLLLALGTGLGLMLREQLEYRDREEIDGKTEVVLHLLRELRAQESIERNVNRVADIVIGHPHLMLALYDGERWLLEPPVGMQGIVGERQVPLAPKLATHRVDDDLWWMRRVQFTSEDDVRYHAYLGLHVNPTQTLLQRFYLTLLVAGLTGVLASALLGWVVARRGLAPVAAIGREAERLTADRLGTPLRAEDVPAEVRGMVESLNRMLERLKASFRALEEFSADIAHELRTPLNNLMLQTQVTLSRPRTGEEYQDALHSNLGELDQLQRMVSDMLFLARADRGMFPLKLEKVSLDEEARRLTEFFELAASEDGKAISVQGEATATCDRAMIRRALTNLLSNAVRFAPANAHIKVNIEASAAEARIAVSNPAPRMSEPELQRLFGRFTRGAHGTPSGSAVEGAGLGLSIVASMLRLHGGQAMASWQDGEMCFTLVLPDRHV